MSKKDRRKKRKRKRKPKARPQTQIDKVKARIESIKRNLRNSEYVWPKHRIGAARQIAEFTEQLRILEEQCDSPREEDESDN